MPTTPTFFWAAAFFLPPRSSQSREYVTIYHPCSMVDEYSGCADLGAVTSHELISRAHVFGGHEPLFLLDVHLGAQLGCRAAFAELRRTLLSGFPKERCPYLPPAARESTVAVRGLWALPCLREEVCLLHWEGCIYT